MCGRAYSPRFMWTWPNSRISVMGGEQAATVLSLIRQEALAQKGETWPAEDIEKFKNSIRSKYEKEGSPYHASAHLWDDGVIDPKDTRRVLGLSITASLNKSIEGMKFGVFRM